MTKIKNALLGVLLASIGLLSAPASFAGTTSFTDADNENNAHTGLPDNDMDRLVGNGDSAHPIEFNVNIPAVPTTSAVLTVRAKDVDEEQGETDDVYLNDVFIGHLSGANDEWHASAFDLASHPGLLVAGNNRVRVMVDTSGDATAWVVNVDWAQILIDGGSGANGTTSSVRITNYSVAGPTVTVNTQTIVHAVTAGPYRVEVNILDPNGQTSTVLTQDFTATAGETVTINSSPTYPLNGVSGTYTIQVQLYFITGGFPLQQDYDTATFVHTQNVGVTDADADGLTNAQEVTLGTNRFNADTDGDGVADAVEVGGNVALPVDTDGDGIIDALESTLVDSDNDGVNNQLDPANTNPCLPNASNPVCLAFDSDGDGLTNAQEDSLGTSRSSVDTDGDGIADGAEVGGNLASPLDTDGDGIPNLLESATADTDGDGLVDSADTDSDNDGIPDSVELGPNPATPLDTDGDGVPNYLDLDSDDDGIPDALEAGPNPAAPVDTDGDGHPDYLDLDSDHDGIPDRLEGGALGVDTDGDGIDDAFDADVIGGADANHDGIADSALPPDTDGDGKPDFRDVDSDGDGLLDTVEANATGHDADGDGVDDAMDPDATGGADANGDGIDDAFVLPDTDHDGVPDFRDLDSDNDAAFDVVEAGLVDANGDAMADAGQAALAVAADTDADGTPDFRDLDSNNDGTRDIVSSGFAALDANGDGRIDAVTDSDGDGIPNVRDAAPFLHGNAGDGDNDGVADAVDQDLDNDGIPNAADGGDDADGDGLPNYADLDSDGDGIADIIEAGGKDADGDRRVDGFVDANHNGLADSVEPAMGGTALALGDQDGDGVTNHRDLDSDADGISDRIESGGTDSNGDGRVDSPVDANHDGLADALESSMAGGHAVVPTDTDGDHAPDYLDLDSDGDGFTDAQEGNGDSDNDGIANFRDSPGKLETAVHGVGALDWKWLALLAGIVVVGRRSTFGGAKRQAVAFSAVWLRAVRHRGLAVPVAARASSPRAVSRRRGVFIALLAGIAGLCASRAHAAEPGPDGDEKGFYVGLDFASTRLEPRDRGGGYVVSDKTSAGFRALGGYRFTNRWSAEIYHVHAGSAGISSDNPAIGELGDIEYRLTGVGAEWVLLSGGRSLTLFPVLKAGMVLTSNRRTDDRIGYERENHVGVFFGGGGAWRFAPRWLAQAEINSYDTDELVFSVGFRAEF